MLSFWRKRSESPAAIATPDPETQSSGASQNDQASLYSNNLIASTSSAAPILIRVCSDHSSPVNDASARHGPVRVPIYTALDSTQLAPTALDSNIRPVDLMAHYGHGPIGLNQAAYSSATTTKLWQSLVLPMVLACIIFLVALWTRQISLALNNDTLAMILILGAIFILLSGAAIWISCDQYFHVDPLQQQQQAGEISASTDIAGNNTDTSAVGPYHHNHHNHHHHHHQLTGHHHRHCPRHHSNSHHRHHHCQHANCALAPGHQVGETSAAEKCCGAIAVIDCQPPDYYSAVLNSVPIHEYLLYNYDHDELNSIHDRDTEGKDPMATLQLNFDGYSMSSADNAGGDEWDSTKRSYLFPPTYEEVSSRR